MIYANSTQATCAPPAPMNPLPGAIDRLGISLNDLGVTAEMLASRLGRVLTPPTPQTTGDSRDSKGCGAPTCDMVLDVNKLRERIENITAQLHDVLNRLEV